MVGKLWLDNLFSGEGHTCHVLTWLKACYLHLTTPCLWLTLSLSFRWPIDLDSISAIIRVKLPSWVEIDEWILSSMDQLLMILQEGNLSQLISKRDNNYRKYSHDDNSWICVLCLVCVLCVLCVLARQLADSPLSGLINVLARQMNGKTFQAHEIPLFFVVFFSCYFGYFQGKYFIREVWRLIYE